MVLLEGIDSEVRKWVYALLDEACDEFDVTLGVLKSDGLMGRAVHAEQERTADRVGECADGLQPVLRLGPLERDLVFDIRHLGDKLCYHFCSAVSSLFDFVIFHYTMSVHVLITPSEMRGEGGIEWGGWCLPTKTRRDRFRDPALQNPKVFLSARSVNASEPAVKQGGEKAERGPDGVIACQLRGIPEVSVHRSVLPPA